MAKYIFSNSQWLRSSLFTAFWKTTPLIFRFVGNDGLHGQLALRMWIAIHERMKDLDAKLERAGE